MYSNGSPDELEPRPVPKPTQFQEISAKPEVPELSVVFESSEDNYSKQSYKNLKNNLPYAASQTTQETYSEWKERQNRSPVHKETRYYETRGKHYYGSSQYSDCDQNACNRFSDRISYKSNSECHKCICQNTPTVKDIYNMMQIQNDQMKFLLETIQKLLVTVLSNQQSQHKCCCFDNSHCKNSKNIKMTEPTQTNEVQEEYPLQSTKDDQTEKQQQQQINLKRTDKIAHKKIELNKSLKCHSNPDSKTWSSKDKRTNSQAFKSGSGKDNKKETERTYSIGSDDESFDLNANDVHVTEAPISPEPSIHIEMKSSSSSEDNSNSEFENEEKDKQIEVGWTMYKNIIGQVNNLLEDSKIEQKIDIAKPVECVKPTPTTSKNFEQYKHFVLPENNQIDSSVQMQALAMQYLSPDQAIKFDMNKHFVPPTQPAVKSPNNYSISTLHYMERYHLIGPEKNYNSENLQHKLSTDGLLNKKKKPSRKNKTPSKILNITELKQQPKLS